MLTSVLALMLACGPVEAQRPKLGNAEQIQVDRAIQDGTKYLLARQQAQNDGSFPGPGHPVGVTALAGLALMESGIGPEEPSMRAAAQYILKGLSTLDDTYDLSLAILFLDRFGDTRYRRQIQTLAVRLIAGQTATGGWSYKCRVLVKRDHDELLRVLRRQEQLEKQETMQGVAVGRGGRDKMRPSAGGGRDEKLTGIGSGGKGGPEKVAGSASPSDAASLARLPRPGMCIKSADDANAMSAPETPAPAVAPAADQPAKKAGGRIVVPGQLGFLPVLQDLNNPGERNALGGPADAPLVDPKARTDNSNTQFAILAMWTAQRHDVPVRRTLQLIVKRFRESHDPDGGWVYGYAKPGNAESTPAMTCSGLAGLAVGFGLTDAKRAGNKDDEKLVTHAFRCLMKFVGEPSEKWDKRVALVENNNLYYLWSIERVAVMYNLPTLGDRDWYRWGAEILVTNQAQSGLHTGAWVNGGNTILADPVVNTSFALLFLRGANLTADLTDRLPINSDDLNKELAGIGISTPRTTPKLPGKSDPKGPLGDAENREKERPIDAIPVPDNPEQIGKQQPATQPAQKPAVTPSATSATTSKTEEGSNAAMIAIFAVVAVIVIAGVGTAIFFVTRKGKKSPENKDEDKPGRARRGSRFAGKEDDEEEEKPRPRRAPPATRAGGRKPSRARYDDDDDDDDD
jgi:hypothetical protein